MSTIVSAEAAALEAIASVSPLPFFGVDADGNVTAWNAAAEELLGRRAVEAVGRPVANDGARALVARALHGATVRAEPIAWRRDDGLELELRLSAGPVADDGGAVACALPLVETPAHVEHVLEGTRIAHELNHVMTAISGYSQLLLATADGPARRDAERIADAADRAVALSRHLGSLVRRAVRRANA
jgi:PAS domain S-box-containing protein